MSLFRKVCIFAALSSTFFASSASSQWKLKAPPPSSPYWWTLTDDLSPQDLRRILTSRKLHRQRYQEAVEGKAADALSAESLESLYYYINGDFTPELFRMSDAFDSFTRRFEYLDGWLDTASETLPRHGVSAAGQSTILSIVEPKNKKQDQLIQDLRESSNKFVELMDKIEHQFSLGHLKGVLRTKDFRQMGQISGLPPGEVERLAQEWQRDPVEEVCGEFLAILKERLSLSDWNAFREYLLKEIAPEMLIVGFDDDYVEGV